MRSSPVRAAGIPSKASLLLSVAAAVLLSACSSSVDRFADPSSSSDDSLYTASVPKKVQRRATRPPTPIRIERSPRPIRDTVSRKPLANNTARRARITPATAIITSRPTSRFTSSRTSSRRRAVGRDRAHDHGPAEPAQYAAQVRHGPGRARHDALFDRPRQSTERRRTGAAPTIWPLPIRSPSARPLRIPGRGNAVAPQPAYAKPEQHGRRGGRHAHGSLRRNPLFAGPHLWRPSLHHRPG